MGLIWASLSFLRTGVGKAVAGITVVALILFSTYKLGDKNRGIEEEIKRKEEYVETRKVIDNAIKDSPSDFNDASEFLRNRQDK